MKRSEISIPLWRRSCGLTWKKEEILEGGKFGLDLGVEIDAATRKKLVYAGICGKGMRAVAIIMDIQKNLGKAVARKECHQLAMECFQFRIKEYPALQNYLELLSNLGGFARVKIKQ